jgi:hypothetical protein
MEGSTDSVGVEMDVEDDVKGTPMEILDVPIGETENETCSDVDDNNADEEED